MPFDICVWGGMCLLHLLELLLVELSDPVVPIFAIFTAQAKLELVGPLQKRLGFHRAKTRRFAAALPRDTTPNVCTSRETSVDFIVT